MSAAFIADLIRRSSYAADTQCELTGVSGIKHCIVITDDVLLIPMHQRLVERLHPILYSPLSDQVRNVQRGLGITNVVLDGSRVDQHLASRHPAFAILGWNQAQRDYCIQRRRENWSSAKRTCNDSRSASLYTATVSMPNSRHARITRRAISPRLAMRTFLNMGCQGSMLPPPALIWSDAPPMPLTRSANSLGLVA